MAMTILADIAHSDEAQCRDVLKKCDTALSAQRELNDSLREVIKDQNSLISAQDEKLKEESIWKPIAIGAGVVVGIETLILILRK